MMGSGYGYNMMGGRFGFMIICIIVIGVVVFAVYKLFKTNNDKDIASRDNSLNILNERFARSEINEDEYNQKKNVLTNYKKL